MKGDSFLVSADERNILIDGGVSSTYSREIIRELKAIQSLGQALDLVVLTHTDDDHIAGLIRLLCDTNYRHMIKEVWFNSVPEYRDFRLKQDKKLSVKQGVNFDTLVKLLKAENPNLNVKSHITCESEPRSIIIAENICINILSPKEITLKDFIDKYHYEKPDKKLSKKCDYNKKIIELWGNNEIKDSSLSNEASIAFELKYKDKNFLFLGDSHAQTISDSLLKRGHDRSNKLPVTLTKLSHHGSKSNITTDLLESISCNKYIISTNGAYSLPHKETLAKIIKHRKESVEFIFNYKPLLNRILRNNDFDEHNAVLLSSDEICFND